MIRAPVLHKVGQELVPIGDVVPLEIGGGEGEGVVDPGDERLAGIDPLEEASNP